jgi:ribosomal protein S18 acetylase RimI-like enzyme
MGESTQSVSIRPATQDDDAFLMELFASTRPEFSLLNLPESQMQALMSMQFNAQRQQYNAAYPQVQSSIVLQGEDRVGRILVDRAEQEITLVDIALLPEYRNDGIGSKLLRDLLAEASAAKIPVRLHVFQTNPALRLYERLGFTRVNDQSAHVEMIFQP